MDGSSQYLLSSAPLATRSGGDLAQSRIRYPPGLARRRLGSPHRCRRTGTPSCQPMSERFPQLGFVSGCRKRGVEFKGGSLHDGFGGFDGFCGSGEHLALLCWSCKIQDKEATVTVSTVLAVLAVVAVSVVTATPLKLNPPFPTS